MHRIDVEYSLSCRQLCIADSGIHPFHKIGLNRIYIQNSDVLLLIPYRTRLPLFSIGPSVELVAVALGIIADIVPCDIYHVLLVRILRAVHDKILYRLINYDELTLTFFYKIALAVVKLAGHHILSCILYMECELILILINREFCLALIICEGSLFKLNIKAVLCYELLTSVYCKLCLSGKSAVGVVVYLCSCGYFLLIACIDIVLAEYGTEPCHLKLCGCSVLRLIIYYRRFDNIELCLALYYLFSVVQTH